MGSFQDEYEVFDKYYKIMLEDLISSQDLSNNLFIRDWVNRLIEYNVPHGKKIRGITTVLAYKTFANSPTEEGLKKSRVLGWCVEILQASFLLADDIMDYSEMRRGRPCWYKLPDVGINGINDGVLLENILYSLISKYFADDPFYANYSTLFKDVTLKTIYGQTADIRTPLEKDFEKHTMSTYQFQVRYKTSYYTYYLPIMLGLTLAGKGLDKKLIGQIESIIFELGFLFQANDDYIDCFGDPKVTRKIGTDIEDGKCTFLFVKAMEVANEDQKIILKENYGKGMKGKLEAKRVVETYRELGIPEIFEAFEKESFKTIQGLIGEVGNEGIRSFFKQLLKVTYQRKA